ncbi:putative ATP-dependent helicase [Hibiscus syriacus]|uniref:ATP-dependent helicase n=1 Tax=Hibiscus syriacus TaxID=106335 RepID=A0A6A2X154_HIBSY|nr:putative ATP-dependent helicase [Hibiscus syriacus]
MLNLLPTQVKAVYVKNLPNDITQDHLKKLFEHHGKITKIVVPPAKVGKEDSRYGFVHFAERSSAMKALKNTKKYEIDGQVLECSLAKPQADQKSSGGSGFQNSTLDSSFPPMGFGLPAGAYGGLGMGFGPVGYGQPLIYGHGPTPAGMVMMPMILPDGRIGYVLQQPRTQPETHPPQSRSSRGGGSGSSGRRRSSSDSYRGRNRYNPY